jgi:hypothetical protein
VKKNFARWSVLKSGRRPLTVMVATACILGLGGAATRSAAASTPVMSFSAAIPGDPDTHYSLGWKFTTNSPINVTDLGYYDAGANGLITTHSVGIFDNTGVLLTSASVDAGTTDPLVGMFRYKSITPYLLAAGQTYIVAGTSGFSPNPGGADPFSFGVIGLTTDPSITIPFPGDRYHLQADDTLTFPTASAGYNVMLGPNFQIGAPETSPVPEPGSLALLACGGMSLLMRRRRRA